MTISRSLSPGTIRQVADANLIEEIISVDLPLKRSGAVLVGLCPFHQDKSPSLTVTPSRQRFKCFGCGAGGDVFGYVMAREGVGFLQSVRLLAQRGGIHLEGADTSTDTSVDRRPRTRPPVAREAARVLILPSDLRTGTRTELQTIAARRGLSVAGLKLASARGLLWSGTLKGLPAWIVKDAAGINAQARRMDGRRWTLSTGTPKAYTLPGSWAAWPIGAREAAAMPCVVLVEGGPDLLAAHHFIVAEGREADTAAVAMLGAANNLPDDALLPLANKRVRLFPHLDAAGRAAALRWTRQLERVGCEVDAFAFDGLRRADGGAAGDLNDLAVVDADDFEAERAELERILPR